MSRIRLLKLASIATVVCLGAALAAPAGAQADRGNIDGELVIASLSPETGDLSAILESLRVPVEIAVDEINAAGGVLDTDVRHVTGDDGTDTAVASVTLDRLLTSDKVDAIMGPAGSTTVAGLLDKIETNAAVMCTGSATSPALSPKGIGGGYFFRTAPPDKLQAPALGDLIVSDGFSRVAIVALNDDYGQGFAKALKKSLKQGGAKIVADVPYEPGGGPYDTDAQAAADKSPDAVALIAFPDTGATMLQAFIAAGIGPADVQIYTTDGLDSSSIPEAVDPANLGVLDGLKGTTPAAAPAAIEHPFQEEFAATGVDAVFSSYFYDCAILTALAAVKANSDDPAKIRKAFKKNLTGKTHCQTFADCKAALEDGKSINYDGASSEFKKFSDHEPLSGVYDVYTFDGAGEKSTLGDDAQISIG
ncbi:MAG: ABC transporter substrate-binding protein [Acidimicrobiia bacterium]